MQQGMVSVLWVLGLLLVAGAQANPADDPRVQEEMARRQPGIVYKTPHFWMFYHNLDAARAVFEGNEQPLEGMRQFRDSYLDLNYAYSNICGDLLPANKITVTRTVQTIYTDGMGGERYRDPAVTHSFSYDPSFYQKLVEYEEWFKQQSKAHAGKEVLRMVVDMHARMRERMSQPGVSLGSLFAGMYDDWNAETAIFSMNKWLLQNGCRSASVYQLRENFRRIAYGEPTLQQAGIKILNAEKETEPAEWVVTKPTLFETCKTQGTSLADFDSGNMSYCVCMESEGARLLNKQELTTVTEQYQDLRALIQSSAQTLPNDHIAWRLQAVRAQCMTVLNGDLYQERRDYYRETGAFRFALIAKQVEQAKQQRQVDLVQKEARLLNDSEKTMLDLRKQPDMNSGALGYVYRVIKRGKGTSPNESQRVAVRMVGETLGSKRVVVDSRVFAATTGGKDDVAHFPMKGLQHLKAVHDALRRMKPGDHWEIFAPPGLGEPTQPNDIVRYRVELLQVL